MPTGSLPARFALITAIAALGLSLAPAASAGKRPGGGGGKTTTNGTISLVPVNSTDGLPHWGQQVRFDVQTTATTEPHVDVTCYQGGTLVYSGTTGYYDSYPWPWTQTFTLSSQSWTGGDADCTAVLYSLSNTGRKTTLATLNFHVYA
jgi:hypothetical protein